MAYGKVKYASFSLAFFFQFMPLTSICKFYIDIFLIDGVTLPIRIDIIFFSHSFFDFRKHEIAIDWPNALD